MNPADVVLFVGLAVASVTDAAWGKIYNANTASMVALGLAIHSVNGDPLAGVLGAVSAFVLHFALFAIGMEKAGDAKLMVGVGALMGWGLMLEATAWYLVLYLPIGLAVAGVRGELRTVVNNSRAVVRAMVKRARGFDEPIPEAEVFMRTGPVIALATGIAWATDWLPTVG